MTARRCAAPIASPRSSAGWRATGTVRRWPRCSTRSRPDGDKGFTIKLKEPFPLLLDGLGKVSSLALFVMPERLANTDPFQQVTEMVGSGPFKFVKDEFEPGHRVVYVKNTDYVPRKRAAELGLGRQGGQGRPGRMALYPRCDDQGRGAQQRRGRLVGEPAARCAAGARRQPRRHGRAGRPARQSDHGAVQPPAAAVRQCRRCARRCWRSPTRPISWRRSPATRRIGSVCAVVLHLRHADGERRRVEALTGKRDFDKAKKLIAEAGYKGEKIVVLDAVDQPVAHTQALVVSRTVEEARPQCRICRRWIGARLVTRRASKEPIDKGGWNIFATGWVGADLLDPVLNLPLRDQWREGLVRLAERRQDRGVARPMAEGGDARRAQETRRRDPGARLRGRALHPDRAMDADDRLPQKLSRAVIQAPAFLMWNVEKT